MGPIYQVYCILGVDSYCILLGLNAKEEVEGERRGGDE